MSKAKKPSWFRWDDFALWGGLSILSAILTVVIVLADDLKVGDRPAGIWPRIGMVFLTLCFFAVYGVLLRARKKVLEGFTWVETKFCGLMVTYGEYKLDINELREVTETTFARWATVVPKAAKVAEEGIVIWVVFKFDKADVPRKVAGYTIAATRQVVVVPTITTQPLMKTAYAHELGHIIQAEADLGGNEAEQHKRARDLKLP